MNMLSFTEFKTYIWNTFRVHFTDSRKCIPTLDVFDHNKESCGRLKFWSEMEKIRGNQNNAAVKKIGWYQSLLISYYFTSDWYHFYLFWYVFILLLSITKWHYITPTCDVIWKTVLTWLFAFIVFCYVMFQPDNILSIHWKLSYL